MRRRDASADLLALLLAAPEREALAEKDCEATGLGLGETNGVRVAYGGDNDKVGVAEVEAWEVAVPNSNSPPGVALAHPVEVAVEEGQGDGEFCAEGEPLCLGDGVFEGVTL